MNRTTVCGAVLLSALLAGCASPGYGPGSSQPMPGQAYPGQPQSAYTVATGTIESIQPIRSDSGIGGSGVGLGTIAGGVVGGLLGHQVGGGSGQTVATIAGAVGGAALGSGVEGRAKTLYQVNVRLDNGGLVTLMRENASDLQIGARVRLDNNNQIYRY